VGPSYFYSLTKRELVGEMGDGREGRTTGGAPGAEGAAASNCIAMIGRDRGSCLQEGEEGGLVD